MNLSPKILGENDSQKSDAASLVDRFSKAKTLVVMHHYVLAKWAMLWIVYRNNGRIAVITVDLPGREKCYRVYRSCGSELR